MTVQPNVKRVSVFVIFGALAVVLLLSVQAQAQVAGATITGTITDPSGAVIPNAEVSITNTATGISTSVSTNSAGSFFAPNLIPGPYQVTMRATGFQTEIQNNITLTVGGQQTLNVVLSVGQTNQTINVTEEVPTVNLSSATISDTVDETTVRELPLNGRDWTTLATLQPGVISLGSLQTNIYETGFNRGNRGLGLQMAVSGARPQLNNYRIDGITVNDYANGGPGSVQGGTLGVDAIQEFSVLTSSYTAEYGRTAGGVINAITRSGTNQFHGTAFEFIRNSALDAANFFDNFSGVPKPPFRQNQFGASAGRAIRKDKTFIFADYEGLRENLGTSILADVPSSAARSGILNFPGGPSTYPTGCVQTTVPNQCAVTVSPLIAPYLPLWQLPNAGLLGSGNTGLFSFAGSQVTTENFVTARVDNKFSDKDSLFGSMEYDHADLVLPDLNDDIKNPSETTRILIVLEETHIFSPRLGNTFRVGYARSFAEAEPSVAVNPLAGNLALGPATGDGPPGITVSGLTPATGITQLIPSYEYPYNSFQYDDDAFLTKGRHNIKFGVAVERDQMNSLFSSAGAGSFQFSTLANFLTDQPKSIRTAVPGLATPRNWRQTVFGSYIQDDIRWRPNLTINLGLRYEMATDLSELHNRLASLHDVFTDQGPTIGPPLLKNPTLRNFAPRVGFAWDPFKNGKTSVRGSFGQFDILPLLSELAYKQNQVAPFNEQGNASHLPPGSFPSLAYSLSGVATKLRTDYDEQDPKRDYSLDWNLDIQRELKPSLTAMVAYVGSHGVHEPFAIDDMNIVLPTLTPIGYLWPFPVGSGTPLNTGSQVSRIDSLQWSNSTSFQALEAQITKKLSYGIQFQGSYTWSKSIDEGDGILIGDPFANSISSLFFFDPKLRRAVSDFNIPQNLTVNFTWFVPTPKSFHGATAAALGGWELESIISVKSGLPFTPNLAGAGNGSNGDPLGLNNSDPFDYPNRLTTGACQSQINPGNVNNYIKESCFTLPTAPASFAAQCGTFAGATAPPPNGQVYCANLLGNSGRNDLYGPGLVNFDFSTFKNIPIKRISESFHLQFRAEFFNIFNHANFNSPIDNSNIFDVNGAPVPGAGLIDSTSTPAREIQFGLKMIW